MPSRAPNRDGYRRCERRHRLRALHDGHGRPSFNGDVGLHLIGGSFREPRQVEKAWAASSQRRERRAVPNVSGALVYVAAFLPHDGQSRLQAVHQWHPDPCAGECSVYEDKSRHPISLLCRARNRSPTTFISARAASTLTPGFSLAAIRR